MTSPPTPTNSPTTPRVAVLDGLRGLAVLLVLVYHLHEYVPILWPGTSAFGLPASGAVNRSMGFFWIGVDLFYVLSGFFIGGAVLRPREWHPQAFIKSRLTRILPAYYVSMVIVLLVLERGMLGNLQGWVNIALHTLMMHNLQSWSMFSINGPYWTLGVEFGFYVLMLTLAPLWRTPKGWLLIPLMFAVCYVWRAGIMVGMAPADRFFWASQLFGTLDEFALGIVVAFLHQRGLLTRAASPKTLLIGGAMALVGVALVLACLHHYISLPTDYWQSFHTVMYSRTVLAAGFALLIAAFLVLAQTALLRNTVRFSGLGWLGMVSFSVYLFHSPVFLLMHRHLAPWFGPSGLWNLVAVALTCVIAYANHRWIERRWHANL